MARKQGVMTIEDILREGERGLHASPPQETMGSSPTTSQDLPQYSGTLDDAATLLLNQLIAPIRDYAFELADLTLKIPRWQLILGAVTSQYESGSLQTPSIDPSWKQNEAVVVRAKCQYCGEDFGPKRYGQLYCSEACGSKARHEAIKKWNEEREAGRRAREAAEMAMMGKR